MQDGRDVDQKGHFSDSNNISIEQCDTTDQIGLSKVVGKVELRAADGRRREEEEEETYAGVQRVRKIADVRPDGFIVTKALFRCGPVILQRRREDDLKRSSKSQSEPLT